MAEVDSRIAMSGVAPQFINAAEAQQMMYRNQLAQAQLQQTETGMQSQNALRTIFGNPANFGKDGNPTPNALTQIGAIDPDAAISIRNRMLDFVQKQQQIAHSVATTKKAEQETAQAATETYLERVKPIELAALTKWKELTGVPMDQRMQQVNELRNSLYGELEKEGDVPKGWLDKKRAQPFNPYYTQAIMAPKGGPGAGSSFSSLSGETTGAANASGDDFLKTLRPDVAKTVKAIGEGRETFSSLGIRGADRQEMVRLVNQYNPKYDQGLAPARFALRKDFTSGQTSKNITALNTAIGHLGTLDELGEALKTKDLQRINQLVNFVRNETGRPEVNNQALAAQAVGEELMRSFRGVGASEKEAAAWQSRFSAANSPEKMRGATKIATELLKSRIDSVNDTWRRGMGTEEGFPDLMSPKSLKVAKRLGIDVGEAKKAGGAPAAKAGAYDDAEKERRYQEWKKRQAQ